MTIETIVQTAMSVAKLLPRGAGGAASEGELFVLVGTGMELGLSPFQALRVLFMQRGRVTLSADAMVGIAMRSGVCQSFTPIEQTETSVTWETTRVGGQSVRKTFTLEDAKRAGLTGREIWKLYPARMLSARAKAYLARDVYPDVLAGLYTEDEVEGMEVPPPPPPKDEVKPYPTEIPPDFSDEPGTDKTVTIPDKPEDTPSVSMDIAWENGLTKATTSIMEEEARHEWQDRLSKAETVQELRKAASQPSSASREWRQKTYLELKRKLEGRI